MPERSDLPVQVVMMGVAGTGKTAVSERVSAELGLRMVEGDEHHPQANIDKMASGAPLNDEDRLPWLRELADILAEAAEEPSTIVLTCSALKRSYRDLLRGGLGLDAVFFVHLHASLEVLQDRMSKRAGHFMPPSLLQSQLDTLEHLGAEERGVLVDVAPPLHEVVATVLSELKPVLSRTPG